MRGRPPMQRALERLINVTLRERPRRSVRGRNPVGVLCTIDKALTHHFDKPRQVGRRVNAQAATGAPGEHPENFQHHPARRRRRHRPDLVAAIGAMKWRAPHGPVLRQCLRCQSVRHEPSSTRRGCARSRRGKGARLDHRRANARSRPAPFAQHVAGLRRRARGGEVVARRPGIGGYLRRGFHDVLHQMLGRGKALLGNPDSRGRDRGESHSPEAAERRVESRKLARHRDRQ